MLKIDHREGVYVLTWILSKFLTEITLKDFIQQQVFLVMKYLITVKVKKQLINKKKANNNVIILEIKEESQSL